MELKVWRQRRRSRCCWSVGGSHAIKEGEVLSDRGYEVLTCAVAGWRANKTAAEQMAAEVQEALKLLSEDDMVVVHCCDNTAFLASSEEWGELLTRKYITGEYHVKGDIVLASKERLYLFFKNCLPFLTLKKSHLPHPDAQIPLRRLLQCEGPRTKLPGSGLWDQDAEGAAGSARYVQGLLVHQRPPGVCDPQPWNWCAQEGCDGPASVGSFMRDTTSSGIC